MALVDHADANARLEKTQWDLFWIPPEAGVIDRPELMVIHCRAPKSYLNTVVRTRARPEALPGLIAEVARVHGHTTSKWLVADTVDTGPLEAALRAAGYRPGDHHEARVARVDRFAPRRADPVLVARPVDSLARLRDCIAVADAAFGRSAPYTDAALADELARCIDPAGRVHRFVVYDRDDSPVCSGGLNVYPRLGIGFLWAGGTVPSARGRGAYSALVAARLARAAELGLEYVGLYAKTDTSSPIVARQGFERCGEMTYWERPATSTR